VPDRGGIGGIRGEEIPWRTETLIIHKLKRYEHCSSRGAKKKEKDRGEKPGDASREAWYK